MSDTLKFELSKCDKPTSSVELNRAAVQAIVDEIAALEAALRGILRITDRKHVAWDAAHAALGDWRDLEGTESVNGVVNESPSPITRSGGFCSCVYKCGDAPGWEDCACAQPYGLLLPSPKSGNSQSSHSLLREPGPLPPGCYCKPGRCAAPVVMGWQTPCRDPAKRDSLPVEGNPS